MGAIVLNAGKVKTYVMPSLNNSENNILTAYDASVSLKNKLPNTFAYKSTVNEIVNQIYNIQKEIKDIDKIIESKLESAKRIEAKGESGLSGIASAFSTIGSLTGGIKGAMLGAATGGVVGAVTGAVVGSKIGSAIGKALGNTGAKIWNGVTKVAKKIGDGIKNIGTKIWDGCKKIAKTVGSFVKDKALPVLKNIGSAILKAGKWVGTQILRVGATVANLVVSTVEGVFSLVEAIVDLAILVTAATVYTPVTFLVDLGIGIATGEWDWKVTGTLWKKVVMPIVGFDATSKLFDLAYENRLVGAFLLGTPGLFLKEADKYAYSWAKRGGTGYNIGKGVGYVAGVVALTIVTFGIGGPAAAGAGAAGAGTSAISAGGATALTTAIAAKTGLAANTVIQIGSGVIAGAASTAKNVQSGYNELSEEEKQSGAGIGKVLGNSSVQGLIEGSTFALTYGGGLKGDMLGKTVSKFFNTHKNWEIVAKAGIQATKAFASDGTESLITGTEFNFAETTQSALVNAAVSMVYDKAIGAKISSSTKLVNNANEALKNASAAGAFKEAASKETEKVIVTSLDKSLAFIGNSDGNKKIFGTGVKNIMKLFPNAIIDKVQGYFA